MCCVLCDYFIDDLFYLYHICRNPTSPCRNETAVSELCYSTSVNDIVLSNAGMSMDRVDPWAGLHGLGRDFQIFEGPK